MQVIIKKGTNQIGGCITEIISKEARIIIDFGEDLPDEEEKTKEPIVIAGLNDGKSSLYDAVFITHSHGDHIGLINTINNDIPIYMSNDTKKIYTIANDFTNKEEVKITKDIRTFDFAKYTVESAPIKIKDLTITPFLADHSAYGSCMYLISDGVKKILHTGDFRNHGRKQTVLKKVLAKIKKVDLLISEGTSLSIGPKIYETENALEIRAKQLFKEYDQIFILQSSTNIDRTVTFVRAALQVNKKFVADYFTKVLNDQLDFKVVIDNKKIFVWKPMSYDYKEAWFKNKYQEIYERKYNYGFLPNYVMQVKSSMLKDIYALNKACPLTKACLVYSMWDGYKKNKRTQNFLEKCESLGMTIEDLHTSGHADNQTLRLVEDSLLPQETIIIHTDDSKLGVKVFHNNVLVEDGQIIEI